jgi:UDP-N-acetylglucosamine 2-epimerase (non-hydrolysing)
MLLKIVNVVGARPNFMKIAPIKRVMDKYTDINNILVHTGQHYDKNMSKLFFKDLELPEPDIYLGVGSGTHAQQTAKIMIEFEKVLESEKPDLIIVVGDVNSTAACSLVAAKMGIKIAHVEAGLRSFDRTMPEEINRIVTDSLADFLFVTEKSGMDNLKNEGVAESKVFFVGNVMIDSLIHFLHKAKTSNITSELHLDGEKYILVTLHRPSNVDIKENLESIIDTFSILEKDLKIVFPAHPRTKKMLAAFHLDKRIKKMENLILLDPVGYLDFIHLMQSATLLLTDSGGIQEETTYLGIPCITMRENTERPVTIELGTNILVGSDNDQIVKETKKIINGKGKKGKVPKLWDGKAAERIVSILEKQFK